MTMQHTRTRALALAAAILMAMTGIWSASPALASGATAERAAQTTSADAHEAGRDLFKALYFGVGPAVDGLLDSLRGSTYDRFVAAAKSGGDEQLAAAEAVADALEAHDPDVFARANENLRSGDVFAVERQFRALNEQLHLAVEEVPTDTAPQCLVTVAVVAAYVWEAAAAVNVVAGINFSVVGSAVALAVAYAAVYVETYFWGGGEEELRATQLAAEEAVASFTKALAD